MRKSIGQLPMFAEIIGELIPDCGVLGIELLGIFILHPGGIFLADIAQKAAVSQIPARAVGMIAQEILVPLFHHVKAIQDLPVK